MKAWSVAVPAEFANWAVNPDADCVDTPANREPDVTGVTTTTGAAEKAVVNVTAYTPVPLCTTENPEPCVIVPVDPTDPAIPDDDVVNPVIVDALICGWFTEL